MKTKYETLKDVISYVQKHNEKPVNELLKMGFTPSQLVREFNFNENDVRNSIYFTQVEIERGNEFNCTTYPFFMDGYSFFDGQLISYFKFTKEKFEEFRGSDTYNKMLEKYNEQKDEALIDLTNDVFSDFENEVYNQGWCRNEQ